MFSCKEESIGPAIDAKLLQIIGSYKAIIFVIPGQNDAPVDVLNKGGEVKLELKINSEITGYLKVPKIANLSGEGFEENFNGEFKISGDSLWMGGFDNPIQGNYLVQKDSLIQKIFSISIKKIVMVKQSKGN